MSDKFTMIELFSGIGAQERALRQICNNYEIVATCDCDKDAVLSYAAMRYNLEEATKGFIFPSQEQMIKELQAKNVGYDFQKSKHTITSRTSLNKLKQYYIADILSNNLGDISKVERLPYADMVTYSFPCTDLSVAGKVEGMSLKCDNCGYSWPINFSNTSDNTYCPSCGNEVTSSTRSGLLGQVQRLLSVSHQENDLPKYLLLENVKNLVGKKFVGQFDSWINWLDSIGYNTYYKVLNAKHYGIPQNRERIFALSIRKDIDDGTFEFPTQIPLATRLKDILEQNVSEQYYISNERVEAILNSDSLKEKIRNRNNTIEANPVRLTNIYGEQFGTGYAGNVWDQNGLSPTLQTAQGGNRQPLIVEEPFIVASRGRNVDDSTTTEQKLEPNLSGTTNTITTVQKDNYVCEPTLQCLGNIYPSNGQNGNIYDADGISPTISAGVGKTGRGIGSNNAPKVLVDETNAIDPIIYDDYNSRISSDQTAINTLTTNCGASAIRNGVKIIEPIVCEERRDEGIRFFKDDCVGTLRTIDACGDKRVLESDITTIKVKNQATEFAGCTDVAGTLLARDYKGFGNQEMTAIVENYDNIKYRIRKLTPTECWRLMGFTDNDCKQSSEFVSDSALYKQAGNSIVTNCLTAIFYSLFYKDSNDAYKNYLIDFNA